MFVDYLSETKEKGHLSTSTSQDRLLKTGYHRKLIEIRDKRLIQNKRQISFLNVDLKIISTDVSEKRKKKIPDLMSS